MVAATQAAASIGDKGTPGDASMTVPVAAEFRRRLHEARTRISAVNPAQAEAMLEAGALVLDVRGVDDEGIVTIPGALRVSAAALPLQAAGILSDRRRPVLVFCANGERSLVAAHELQILGYERVVSLAGGLGAWQGPLSLPASPEPLAHARVARAAKAWAMPCAQVSAYGPGG